MKNISLSIFASILFSLNAFAGPTNHLVYLAGGGEPLGIETTIFDDAAKNMGKYLQSSSWHSDILFDGGHSVSESILNSQFTNNDSKAPFTISNYRSVISSYETQITNGTIKPGEQILIYVDTHGSEASSSTSSHYIAAGASQGISNMNTLAGTQLIDMDSLKNLRNLAEQHGVKLAIVDTSCHSGNAQALADDKTCVVSSTGPHHFGDVRFSQKFINNMRPGQSLEDVFLKTRLEHSAHIFPMISTNASKALFDKLYSCITPYLYYRNGDHDDKLSTYLIDAVTTCPTGDASMDNLFTNISQLQAWLNDTTDTSELKRLVALYDSKQKQIMTTMQSWGLSPLLKDREKFSHIAIFGKRKEATEMSYSISNLLTINFDKILSYFTDKMNQSKGMDAARYKAQVECLQDAQARQRVLRQQYPNLGDYEKQAKNLIDQMGETFSLVDSIAQEENKLYQNLYTKLSKQDKGHNACKDFIF